MSDSEHQAFDNAVLRKGLKAIRRRRWFLWTTILAYMPLMGMAMSYNAVSEAFVAWFIALFSIAFYAAVVRCPRCGNYFHLHGPSLLFLRKCLHCQLHVIADKRP